MANKIDIFKVAKIQKRLKGLTTKKKQLNKTLEKMKKQIQKKIDILNKEISNINKKELKNDSSFFAKDLAKRMYIEQREKLIKNMNAWVNRYQENFNNVYLYNDANQLFNEYKNKKYTRQLYAGIKKGGWDNLNLTPSQLNNLNMDLTKSSNYSLMIIISKQKNANEILMLMAQTGETLESLHNRAQLTESTKINDYQYYNDNGQENFKNWVDWMREKAK